LTTACLAGRQWRWNVRVFNDCDSGYTTHFR